MERVLPRPHSEIFLKGFENSGRSLSMSSSGKATSRMSNKLEVVVMGPGFEGTMTLEGDFRSSIGELIDIVGEEREERDSGWWITKRVEENSKKPKKKKPNTFMQELKKI